MMMRIRNHKKIVLRAQISPHMTIFFTYPNEYSHLILELKLPVFFNDFL